MDALKRLGQACACAGAYYLAFRFAWFHSADQFFLPAGLRVACLLFMPYRLWPSILIADAAAVVSFRVPFAAANGFPASWAYGSAVAFIPTLAAGVLLLRKLWPDAHAQERRLPFVLIGLSTWAVLSNISINAALSGPVERELAAYAYKVIAGQYLTSLVAVLPVAIWLRRFEFNDWGRVTRGALLGILALLAAYFGAGLVEETWQRLALLGLMLLPALALAVLHGWRGAAIGVVAANLALGLSIPDTGVLGNRDLVVFVVQQTLAIMGTSLLLVGAAVSMHFDRGRRLAHATREQRMLARADHMYLEQALRDRAEAIAEAQQRISSTHRETVRRLREHGHYALAMQINAESVASTRIVYQQASDLYPFQLETAGLFAVLRSPEFSSKLSGGRAKFRLTGSTSGHSLAFQLVAYRCICHAIKMLPSEEYRINVKAGRSRYGQWLVAAVAPIGGANTTRTKTSRMAQVQLSAKLQAYGGRHKFDRHKVAILLTDQDQGLRSGTTIQDNLSVPLTTLTTKSSEL
ncbi:MASE1 domain-containing protein [Xanthomonas sacchari]|uniref:MASE1 domain-containing protein n=1 Tax=Xanthomonas sacchari TaxID=56458 RepID=UPI00225DDC70|nr:MASE1 domain-containing protein [Xanthomonas sacchari]UYK82290.1 MASE1 domain-containing protein [Xanthomonas sacchari]